MSEPNTLKPSRPDTNHEAALGFFGKAIDEGSGKEIRVAEYIRKLIIYAKKKYPNFLENDDKGMGVENACIILMHAGYFYRAVVENKGKPPNIQKIKDYDIETRSIAAARLGTFLGRYKKIFEIVSASETARLQIERDLGGDSQLHEDVINEFNKTVGNCITHEIYMPGLSDEELKRRIGPGGQSSDSNRSR